MTLDPSVQVALVPAVGAFMVAVLGLIAEGMRRNHNALRAVQVDTSAAREQVQNSHSTNLRDDVDRVISALDMVLDAQKHHGAELSFLRGDIHQERTERLAVAERLDTHLELVAREAAAIIVNTAVRTASTVVSTASSAADAVTETARATAEALETEHKHHRH